MSKKVSVYNGVKDNVGVSVDINTVVERIKSGDKGLREKTERLNLLYVSDRAAYDVEKMELPAVTWSGTFPEGERKGDALVQHSAYVVLDIDNNVDIVTVRADLSAHPNVSFAFVSPSDTGIKPLIKVSPVPMSVAEHHAAFDAVLDVFRDYVDQDPTKLPAQRDPNRLCFLAYDPNPIMNAEAVPVPWELPASLPVPESPSAPDHSPPSVVEAIETLRHISNDVDYPRWIEVGMAIKSAGLPMSVFQEWTGGKRKRSSGEWKDEDISAKWVSFNSAGVNWGSVVHWSLEAQGKKPNKKGKDAVDKPTKLNSVDVAESFMDNHDYWFTHEDLHQYNLKTGLYDPCVPELRKSTRQQFGRSVKTTDVNEVENHITDMAHRSDFGSDGVVFKNGVLDLNTMELSPHTPDRYYLTSYPVNYIPPAGVNERPFTEYLNELVLDFDAVVTLLQMIGSCFDSDVYDLQTAFMLTGSGSNGKSTLLEIIESLVGVGNISRTPFPDYGKERWAKGDLVGKSVALDDDIDLNVPLSSAIKPLITQKYQQCEQKYKDAFDFKMEATFIGAINGQPHTLDTTNAFWRRWCILDFPNIFDKDAGRKREIMDTFTAPDMLDDIASMSLRQYAKARKAGHFFVPAHSAELVESFKEDTNHVITFANDCLEHEPEGHEKRSSVWGAYNDWADKNRIHKTYGNRKFWSALSNLNYKTTRRLRLEGKQERVVDDVKLI